MFHVSGSGGAPCPRCHHRVPAGAACCDACGMMAGAPRHPAVLLNNRWVAAADELAVFFGVRELSGLFVKTLRVPAATRAYILQGSSATEVPQGEYEIEGFFTRLNNLLRDQHAEILITRTVALPVDFEFDDLQAADGMALATRFSVRVKVGEVAAFARHFMTSPGVVKTLHLRELLEAPVRQVAAEFLAAQSLPEMAGNRDLRMQLDERLSTSLSSLLADFGLAIVGVNTLSVRHAAAGQAGSAWLAGSQADPQACSVQQLYGDQEWQRMCSEAQRAALPRPADGPPDEAGQRELALQQAARMQALRVREIELYGRIVESATRKQAIERGAAAAVQDIEHALASRRHARATEAIEWTQLRELAAIRMRTALEAAQRDAHQQHTLARQQFMHQLERQQLRFRISQAQELEDAAHQRGELAALHEASRALQAHGEALERERRNAALESLRLGHRARLRQAERELEWEEQQGLARLAVLARGEALADERSREDIEQVTQRIAAVRRDGERADALAMHERLLRTIEADTLHLRAQQGLALEAQAQRHRQKMEEQETAWQRELQLRAHDIARMQALDRTADATKLVLAGAANAQALADYLKTQVHAGMSAGQLEALSGSAAAARAAGGPPAITP